MSERLELFIDRFYNDQLSFDGGAKEDGGLGRWNPRRLSRDEIRTAIDESGEQSVDDLSDGPQLFGEATGILAAKEFADYLRLRPSNFWKDEMRDDLLYVLIDMLDLTVDRLGTRRWAEFVTFVDGLFPYLAFGCRNITEDGKGEDASR